MHVLIKAQEIFEVRNIQDFENYKFDQYHSVYTGETPTCQILLLWKAH